MIQKITKNFFFFALCAGVLVHCSSDSDSDSNSTQTPESSASLTTEQSNALMNALSSVVGLVVDGAFEAGAVGLTAANFITADISKTDDCQPSGTVSATGTQEGVEGGTIDGASAVSFNFDDCAIEYESDTFFTINGTLDAEGVFDLVTEETGLNGQASLSYLGSLEVAGDPIDEEGTCGVNITVGADAMGTTVELTATGTLCGDTVDYTETINIDEEE